MYASKSFCNIHSLISNVPGTNSPVGEITTEAETYTKELGIYKSSSIAGYTLFNLKSADDLGVKSAMNQTLVNEGVALSDHIFTYVQGLTGQVFYDQLLANVETFAATLNLTAVTMGPVVQHGNLWMPDWIKWTSTSYTPANENTIWFSAAALATQYTEFEIVVVPPISGSIDLFFQPYATVNTTMANVDVTDTFDRIQLARGGNPYTVVRSDLYPYINPLNNTQTVPTYWSVLIYGPAGNNIDSIKDAIVTYILANSTHSRTEWATIFPDIFKRTEFILAPLWNDYAIPNRTLQTGVYSPIVNRNKISTLLDAVVPSYSTSHINTHAAVFGHNYNSIAIACIGGIENRNSLFELNQVFSDYIDVGSGSTDFNRMSPLTQGFSSLLGDMLVIAETVNQFTDVPLGFTKLTRDGILFVVKTYNNIQFLVASKASVSTITF